MKKLIYFFILIIFLVGCSKEEKKISSDTIIEKSNLSFFDNEIMDIKPTSENNEGVFIDSDFILNMDNSIKNTMIEDVLYFEPKIEFEVKNIDDNKWQIRPNNQLMYNTLYNAVYREGESYFRYAFQTQKKLEVTSVSPLNRSVKVGIDEPITIEFSKNITEKIQNFIEIEPKVEGKYEIYDKILRFIPKNFEYDRIYKITVSIPKEEKVIYEFQTEEKGDSIPKLFPQDFYSIYPDNKNIVINKSAKVEKAYISLINVDQVNYYKEVLNNQMAYSEWVQNSMKYREEEFKGKVIASYILSDLEEQSKIVFDFPEKFDFGQYIILIKVGDEYYKSFVQYQPFKISQVKGDTFSWIYLLGEKNAPYKIYDGNEYIEFDKVKNMWSKKFEGDRIFNIFDSNNNEYLTYMNKNEIENKNRKLYLDQNVIKSGERIHFFGTWDKIESLKLALYKNGDEILKEQTIYVEDGFYSGIFSLNNLPVGTYKIKVYSNNDYLEVPVYIVEENKEDYAIAIDTNKQILIDGESLIAEIRVSLFNQIYDKGGQLYYDLAIGKKNYNGRVDIDELGVGKLNIPIEVEIPSWVPIDTALNISFNIDNKAYKVNKPLVIFPKPWIIQEKHWVEGTSIYIETSAYDINIKENTLFTKPFPAEKVKGSKKALNIRYTWTGYNNEDMIGRGETREVKNLKNTIMNPICVFKKNPNLNYKLDIEVIKDGEILFKDEKRIYNETLNLKNNEDLIEIYSESYKENSKMILYNGRKADYFDVLKLYVKSGENIEIYNVEDGNIDEEYLYNKDMFWIVGYKDNNLYRSNMNYLQKDEKELKKVIIKNEKYFIGDMLEFQIEDIGDPINKNGFFYIIPEELFQKSNWFSNDENRFEIDNFNNWNNSSILSPSFKHIKLDKTKEKYKLSLPSKEGRYRLLWYIFNDKGSYYRGEQRIEVLNRKKIIGLRDNYLIGEQPEWKYYNKDDERNVILELFFSDKLIYQEEKKVSNLEIFVPPSFKNEGEYSLVMRQKNEETKDYIEYPIRVRDKSFENKSMETHNLKEKNTIDTKDYYKEFYLMNKYAQKLYGKLISISDGDGFDFDEIYSKKIALALLYNNRFTDNIEEVDVSKFQNSDGGVSNNIGDKSDIILSAKAYYFNSKGLQDKLLKNYLNSKIGESEVTDSIIYWAFSSRKEPIYLKLKDEAKGRTNYTSKIYTVLAFLELGAEEEAKMYYDLWFKTKFEQAGIYNYVETEEEIEKIEFNLLAAILNSRMGNMNWEGNLQYIKDHSSISYFNFLDQIMIIENVIKYGNTKGILAYNSDEGWVRKAYDGFTYEKILGEDLSNREFSGYENMTYSLLKNNEDDLTEILINNYLESDNLTVKKGELFNYIIDLKWSDKLKRGNYKMKVYIPNEIEVLDDKEKNYIYYDKEILIPFYNNIKDRELEIKIPCIAQVNGIIKFGEIEIKSEFPEKHIYAEGLLLEVN